MSNFGILMIVIWGLAYISVAKNYNNVKWLIGVFAVEKFIYGYIWTTWMLRNSVSAVFEKDLMLDCSFLSTDLMIGSFLSFFLFVFIQLLKDKKQ